MVRYILYGSCTFVLGLVGIELGGSGYEPERENEDVTSMLERVFQFSIGIVMEPILGSGRFPVMVETTLHDSFPAFKTNETLELQGRSNTLAA